jgi:hypothetical protein
MKRYLILLLASLYVLSGCKKEADKNDPFAHNQQNNNPKPPETDPATIQGLHQRIFSVKCANPGCHDGTFEPDFRTVQSSYSTLVFQPIVKPDPDSVRFIQYRVIPKDTTMSWLWERLTTNDTLRLGRMPSNGQRLPKSDLENIKKWIMDGCKDMYGKPAQRVNLPPVIDWYFALGHDDSTEIKDRQEGWASPLIVPRGKDVYFYVRAQDDSLVSKYLEGNVMYFSYDPASFDYQWKAVARYKETWYGFWRTKINTSGLPVGKPIYMRFSTVDPLTKVRVEYPNGDSPDWLRRNWSFVVQ